jgi:hypothetical protein
MMFLLMVITAVSRCLHNFSAIAKRSEMMNPDYSMVSLYWCTMQKVEKAWAGARIYKPVGIRFYLSAASVVSSCSKKQTTTAGKIP